MVEDSGSMPETPASFGPFRLYPRLRRLERDNQPVELGGRAFDILCVLVARAGQVVDSGDLLSTAWGSMIVGDGSLRLQINALRKVFDDDPSDPRYIRNVRGRGYCFIAPVSRTDSHQSLAGDNACLLELGRLPAQPARVAGRNQAVQDIAAWLAQWRFVNIVGPGGIGKTTVSVSAGYALASRFDIVCFVDLGALSAPGLVPSAVASALGLMVSSEDPTYGLVTHLKDRKVLLILDSCDPVVEAAAFLAECIFGQCPQVGILTSCREPLRAEGEHVYHLSPLTVPADSPTLTAEQALAFSAVELFVSRIQASLASFELHDSNAAVVAAMCRKLDGIPLAIELAAGRVAALGLETTASLLNSRFALAWQGRRTAVPRHRTLRAALAWSVELLDDCELDTLTSLSVFAGSFTLEAAQAVAGSGEVDRMRITESLARLVEKSLVSSLQGAKATRFWLLDVTREYVNDLLVRSDRHSEVSGRHAVFQCEFLESTYAGPTDRMDAEVRRSDARNLSNVRAALEWTAMQPNLELMSRLAAAVGPLLLDLALLDECKRWTERGLRALDASMLGTSREMELRFSLGLSLMLTHGYTEEARIALERATALAESLGGPCDQLRMLGTLNLLHQLIGELRKALALARQAGEVAKRQQDPACTAIADWLLGSSSHLAGDDLTGVKLGERALSSPTPSKLLDRVWFGFDVHRIRCLAAWARGLFVLGYPDQALRAAARVAAEADKSGHPIALGVSLVWTAPVLVWAGDWVQAQIAIDRIDEHALQHGLRWYGSWGRGLLGYLLIQRGKNQAGVELLQELYTTTPYGVLLTTFSAPLAWGLAQQGRFEEALTTIDRCIDQVESEGGSFDLPELIRVKAAILFTLGSERDAEAEELLLRSLEQARRQSARAWELRSATTVAQLRIRQGRAEEAASGLSAVYSRFNEGFQTADLSAARSLLDELATAAER